ncbi:hypothetical protein A2768_01905 [Candidatus Roizmanbacteria bacterium RIFCSPHIGHO2_01_FULL_37_16]|nr:MAG: hypothetical protein A2768_01905 [Candidatus Roizmanbacteria bacterium RIFCSPHIGHO2_01_FULL_37_16]
MSELKTKIFLGNPEQSRGLIYRGIIAHIIADLWVITNYKLNGNSNDPHFPSEVVGLVTTYLGYSFNLLTAGYLTAAIFKKIKKPV